MDSNHILVLTFFSHQKLWTKCFKCSDILYVLFIKRVTLTWVSVHSYFVGINYHNWSFVISALQSFSMRFVIFHCIVHCMNTKKYLKKKKHKMLFADFLLIFCASFTINYASSKSLFNMRKKFNHSMKLEMCLSADTT